MAEPTAWPRVIVITDRRRLVERMEAAEAAWPELLEAQIAGALAAGADLVQVREPDLTARTLAAFLRGLFDRVPASARCVVVNDRADVALVTGAAGVHLTEHSLELTDVRRLQSADKKWVIGRSVHEAATAGRNQAATYLLAGTVRPSASKPREWHLLGWDGLAAIVLAAGETPVVAVGGLGPSQVAAVRRAGAVGVAGIGCFLPDAASDVAGSVRAKVQAMRKAFDSTGGEF